MVFITNPGLQKPHWSAPWSAMNAHKIGGFLLQAFQGLDAVACGPCGQHGAGEDGLAVHQDGAQPAVGGVAPPRLTLRQP